MLNFNDFIKESEFSNISEALPRQKSVDQLKRVMKISKKTDIGKKVPLKGGNLHFDRNPIENGIMSYEDFESLKSDI